VGFEKLLVVETAVGLAAPIVTRLLAEFGADAIKLESSKRLDFTRTRLRPPGMSDAEFVNQPIHDMGASTRSVCVNLKHEEGRELFLRTLDRADVYIENYATGWLERLGLSLKQIQERSPHLIILSQSAFGGEGPDSNRRAYAPIMTALAGLDSLVGYDDGRITTQTALATGDVVAAYYGAALVLAALDHRARTGKGVLIDQSQTECSAALIGVAFAEHALSGAAPQPRGNTSPSESPSGVFHTAGADDWVAITAWTDQEWLDLCHELGVAPDFARRFSDGTVRLEQRKLVEREIERATMCFRRDELVARLTARGLSCAPVLTCDEFDTHPVHTGRDLWSDVADRGGVAQITQIPWRFDNVVPRSRFAGEPLGHSTRAVMEDWLGLAPDKVERLIAEGALV
jgi:crotonobetainyl-CoA:carnitine CoA-transferase CaiB-like acyl-CoA transferase